MKIDELLTEAREQGVELWVEENQVRYRARDPLPAQLRAQLTAHKAELLPVLLDKYDRARAIARHCDATRTDLATHIAEHADLLKEPTVQSSPAESLVGTCQRFGVLLRIDPDGTLVVNCEKAVGLTSSDWNALRRSLEAHTEAVAALVRSGWALHANFPEQVAA